MSRAALGVCALATAAVLLRAPGSGRGVTLALMVVAFAALAVLVGAERRRPRLGRGLAAGAAAALLVLAVVVPPRQSGDVWSYAMYGRMVTEYQASPYRHTPAEYRDDPIGRRVPRFWESSRSVYGPAFTAVSVAGMAVAGRSATVARVFFQGLAALAVALALLLVDRRARDPVALAVLGVNPLTVVSVVNGGHNDALIGLALLGGVLLVATRRPTWAGLALGGAALVKVAALLPLAVVALWAWRHHGRRAATVLTGTAAAVGLAGLVLAGGTAVLDALGDLGGRVNGGSVWAGPYRWMEGSAPPAAGGGGLAGTFTLLGTLVAAGLAALLAVRRERDDGLVVVAAGAVVAYLLVGAYVLPWYLAWGLPLLALAWRWRVGWLVMACAAVLALGTARPPVSPSPLAVGDPVSRLQIDLYQIWAPLLEVATVVVIVVATVRRLRRTRSAGDGPAAAVAAPAEAGVSPAAARPR
jgi:alpha-1,6-mannosyltransferase